MEWITNENVDISNCDVFLNKILVFVNENEKMVYKKTSLFIKTCKEAIAILKTKNPDDIFYDAFLLFIDHIIPDFANKSYKFQKEKINRLLKQSCKNETFPTENIPWAKTFRDDWRIIKEEMENFNGRIPEYREISQLSANTVGWKVLFLRAGHQDTKNIIFFERTKSILDTCECVNAFFSILEPGTKIRPHMGPYQGVVRYHLGLIIPKQVENCFITVNGIKLYWGEGQDLMFDDMFLHHVENNTSEKRVVLFLDIIREFSDPILDIFNKIILKFIKYDNVLTEVLRKVNKI
jgi:aspartyl/asparaginyl beta-hydroxylase (cupin superfamily)